MLFLVISVLCIVSSLAVISPVKYAEFYSDSPLTMIPGGFEDVDTIQVPTSNICPNGCAPIAAFDNIGVTTESVDWTDSYCPITLNWVGVNTSDITTMRLGDTGYGMKRDFKFNNAVPGQRYRITFASTWSGYSVVAPTPEPVTPAPTAVGYTFSPTGVPTTATPTSPTPSPPPTFPPTGSVTVQAQCLGTAMSVVTTGYTQFGNQYMISIWAQVGSGYQVVRYGRPGSQTLLWDNAPTSKTYVAAVTISYGLNFVAPTIPSPLGLSTSFTCGRGNRRKMLAVGAPSYPPTIYGNTGTVITSLGLDLTSVTSTVSMPNQIMTTVYVTVNSSPNPRSFRFASLFDMYMNWCGNYDANGKIAIGDMQQFIPPNDYESTAGPPNWGWSPDDFTGSNFCLNGYTDTCAFPYSNYLSDVTITLLDPSSGSVRAVYNGTLGETEEAVGTTASHWWQDLHTIRPVNVQWSDIKALVLVSFSVGFAFSLIVCLNAFVKRVLEWLCPVEVVKICKQD